MSKLLIKILKSSILPASLMVIAKLAGIVIAVVVFNEPLTLSHEVDFFTVRLLFGETANTFLINTVASIILILSMNIGAMIVFIKQNLYLKTHGSPRTVLKLSKLNLLKWITKDDGGFVSAFMWTLFLLATNAIVIGDSLLGNTTGALGVFAFLSTLIFVWGLVKTFESETATIYPRWQ